MRKLADRKKFMAQFRGLPCGVDGCSSTETTGSHIKSRGSGGKDSTWNVIPMCFTHHREWEDNPKREFLDKYPEFWERLKGMGWELEVALGMARLINSRG